MRLIGRGGAGMVGVIGIIVLTGWYTGASSLTTIFPGYTASMKPTAAFALVVLSVAIFVFERPRVTAILGLTAATIGLTTLAEFVFGVSLGVDVLLPGIEFAGQNPRMAPATAASLLLLGGAVAASGRARPTLTLWLSTVALFVSEIALLGYAYEVSSLYTVGGFTSMALHTALAVGILSLSIMFQLPDHGLIGLLRDSGSAGRLLRPVIPAVILGPFVLGLFSLWAQRLSLFDTSFGVATLVLSMTILACGLGWQSALRLRELDRQRDGSQQALFDANHHLEALVEDRTHELAGTADRLNTLIRMAPVGIVQLNAAGDIVSANDEWSALSGLSEEEARHNGWARAVHRDDAERVAEEWAACHSAGTAYETTMRFQTTDGRTNWVQVSTAPIYDVDIVTGHLATITDVTALRAAEAAATEARAHFAAAFASSPLGTAIVSRDGLVLEANRRLFEMTGRSGGLLDEPIETIFMPVESVGKRSASLIDGPSTRQRIDRRISRPDSEEIWVKVSVVEIQEHGGLLYQLEDITARRLAEARVEHLAFHDPLTNLPNRLLLLDRLKQALLQAARRGRGVGVLFIDLDRFKVVNDSLGHHAGDIVLTEVADRLRQNARPTDTVARIGGDEFVVICPDVTTGAEVFGIADLLQAAIALPIRINDQIASVDASIGISFGVGHDSPESLLRDADQAMYLAKDRGRSRYEVFDDDLRVRIERRLDTEIALREAVSLGEIETWYQPIVDLQEQRVVATEALARWRRPGRGLVQPAEFIAIAEEVGLIKQIGHTVLNQACRAASTLDGPIAVSVNVSARQFVRDDFGAVVKKALAESGLPPERLWLELTESAVMDAIDSAAKTFQELRDIGVRLAIDDFGTGYSSFTHLRAFTVDLLKIDMTFTRDIERSDHDRAIVEGILRLADSLNLNVVAEGIETASQRDLLASMGCRFGQGYLFSKPSPVAAPTVIFDDAVPYPL